MTPVHRSETHNLLQSTDAYLIPVEGDLDVVSYIRRTAQAIWPL